MATELTQSQETFRKWHQRVDGNLEDLADAAENRDRLRDVFDERLTNHGNSEEKLAVSQEGRELIELIQNARDAIREGDPAARQVYVGIFDQGLLVANTGVPFDLRERDKERAVKMVGESNKTDGEAVDLDSDTIGHIGVGLKSTLSVGDSFEVWTRLEDVERPLRVRYSRAYITAAIAARFGHSVNDTHLGEELIGPFSTAVENGLFSPETETGSEPYPLLDDLGKVPLFWYPWPLDPTVGATDAGTAVSDSMLVKRSNQLLTDPGTALECFESPPDHPFQTAVFIEYEDEEWRELLDELDIPSSEELSPPADPEHHADELWQTLAYASERKGGFDPETLLHLGEIKDLYIERVQSGTDDSPEHHEFEHWTVENDAENVQWPDDGVHHQIDTVEISVQGEGQHVERFDRFEAVWADAEETKPRILIEREDSPNDNPPWVQPESATRGFDRTYPLYLYYPISNTSGALPFCLHGRFKVTTERKDLSQNGAEQNRAVLEDTARLVGRIARSACNFAANEGEEFWARFPWLLLPEAPPDYEIPDTPRETDELLEYLRSKIYEELKDTACLPTTEGGRKPERTILYPSSAVIEGFAAGVRIAQTETEGTDLGTATDDALLNHAGLRWATTIIGEQYDGERRCRTLLDDPAATDTLDEWAAWLSDNLAQHATGETTADEPALTITVPAETARNLFQAVVRLLQQNIEEEDTTARAVLNDSGLTTTLDGVYLLPCAHAGEDGNLDLVALETRSSEDIQAGRGLSRTVVWDLNVDDLRMEFPPEDADFDFFFFDQQAERGAATDILTAAGRERVWGVHKYDGPADLFEALLERFTHSGNTIDGGRLGAFTRLLQELGPDSSRFNQSELAFANRETLKATPGSDQKRNDVRTRLGVRRAALQLADRFEAPIADTTLNDKWQRLRAGKVGEQEDDDDDEETVDWEPIEPLGNAALPTPDQESALWASVPLDTAHPEVQRQVAKTLSLLGASTLPGLRFIPMYDHLHPSFSGQSRPHWNPQEWADADLSERGQHRRSQLAELVTGTDYEQWLHTVSYRSENGVSHAKSCDGNPNGGDGDGEAYLLNWAWIDPELLDAYTDQPDAVLELFRRYGETYVKTILTTHWYCRSYDRCTTRDRRTIPTVANHQLRQLPVWSELVDVSDSLQGVWEEKTQTLDCTVLSTGQGGREGWRLFPYINPEKTDIPESVFEALGVTKLEDISLTEAEHRLQAVQAALAATSNNEGLDAVETPVELQIPPEQRENWKRTYTLLLQPIMQYCRDHESDDPSVVLTDAFTFLDHLPLKRGDKWVTASIDWIQRHGGETVWRYPEESPPRWVEQELENDHGSPDCLLEYPITQAGFSDFAKLLGVDPIKAEEPTLSRETHADLVVSSTEALSEEKLENWRDELEVRLPLLLAVLETRQQQRLEEMAARVESAIQHLSVVRHLPEGIENDLSDPRSVTVEIPEAAKQASEASKPRGLAINLEALDREEAKLSDLAMGFALLTEQYRSVSIFQRVLDGETQFESLKESLQKETFPVEDVVSFLRDRKQKDLQTRLEAGRELLDGDTPSLPSTEAVMNELTQLDQGPTEILNRLAEDLGSDRDLTELPENLQAYLQACREAPEWTRATLELLFCIKETGYGDWRSHVKTVVPDDAESRVIDWLVRYENNLPVELIDRNGERACHRLRIVWQVWINVENEYLQTPSDWREPVDAHTVPGVPWAKQVPSPIAEELSEAVYWFDLVQPAAVEDAARAVQQVLVADELAEQTAEQVYQFVIDATPFPEKENEQSQDHKNRAFSEARNQILDEGVESFAIQATTPGDVGTATAQGQSNGSGGGSGEPTSFIGRGEQAEVAVTVNILQRLTEWFTGEFDARYSEFQQCFRQLYEDQCSAAYQWHTKSKWEQELLDLVETDATTARRHFLDWETLLDNGRSFNDLIPIRLLDVSGEQGPGFDIIDPFGSHSPDQDTANELAPVPVEIKAVDTVDGPFSVRLTTNEYQQSKLHTRTGDHPYSIRMVYVPTDRMNGVQEARYVGQRNIWDEDDLQQLLGEHPFDMSVRSGYLRFTFSETGD